MRYRFALFTAYMTGVALILGNLVVATNAGDACGTDWPVCNGQLIPGFTDYRVLIEYFHRLFTGLLGFVILINFILAWKRRHLKERSVTLWAVLTMVLLFVQSMVGALNVVLGTPSGFTAIDVTVSLLLLTSTVFLATALQRTNRPLNAQTHEVNRHYKKVFQPACWAFLLFFMEIIIGAFLKHSGASQLLHQIESTETLIETVFLSELIFNVHGISNTAILISAAYLLFRSMKDRVLIKESTLFFGLIILNGAAGYLTQFTDLQNWVSSFHMIIAIITVFQGAYLVSKSFFGVYYFSGLLTSGRPDQNLPV